MQSLATSNMIYSGRHPFTNMGSQTDRKMNKPTQQRAPMDSPNDTQVYHFLISLKTLQKYTGDNDDNYYLITLPTIVDRPKQITILSSSVSHLDTSNTNKVKTVLLRSPLIERSGFRSSVSISDELMAVLRVPHETRMETIVDITTTISKMTVSVKEQGFSRIIGIPILFTDASTGQSLSVKTDGDINPDSEILIQIETNSYNPSKQQEHRPVIHSTIGSVKVAGSTT